MCINSDGAFQKEFAGTQQLIMRNLQVREEMIRWAMTQFKLLNRSDLCMDMALLYEAKCQEHGLLPEKKT